MFASLLLWSFVFVQLAYSHIPTTSYNNRIQDEPEVQCGHGVIRVKVRTETKRPSYIFAKGHFRNPECSFHDNDTATFTFEHCNINRKREVNPRGMAYSLTVIVQLHPLFITKVDRAYNVRCFYMEENKEVNAEFAVSDLMTTVIQSGHAMPQCSYTLHRDSPNGPVLRYARVGDLIYHVWDCPSDVYAMLVHTCSILDGHGDEHIVVDSMGCSTDDYIIPQLTYSNDLTRSFTGANVVNLPDSESVYFSCQIKLCLKSGDYCDQITPPKCNNREGGRGETIEEVLDSDQLFATTAALPSTSNEPVHTTLELSSVPSLIANITEGISQNETARFPIPESILNYIAKNVNKKKNKDVDSYSETIEGSGAEDIIRNAEHSKGQLRFKKSMKAANEELVDVDVSTPELRIIENEFGLPDFATQQALGQPTDSVCLPLLGVWLLTVVTVVAVTAAAVTVYRSRHTRQKLSLVY